MEAIITKHALKRLKKRSGISIKGLTTLVNAALEEGTKPSETTGKLRAYCDNVVSKTEAAGYGAPCNLRLYKNFVFAFIGRTLITAFAMPGVIQAQYQKQLQERNLTNSGRLNYD